MEHPKHYHIEVDGEPFCDVPINRDIIKAHKNGLITDQEYFGLTFSCGYDNEQIAEKNCAVLRRALPNKTFKVVPGHCPMLKTA